MRPPPRIEAGVTLITIFIAASGRAPVRTLTIDIETSPALAYVWGIHKQHLGMHQVVQEPRMLCFAAKWLDAKAVTFRSERDNDMLSVLWDLLDEADAVIHYNGSSFDVPHIQREFLLAGLAPPAPYAQIDLWRTVRSQFRFLSTKLDSVTRSLDIGHKAEHEGLGLWIKCLDGDADAWKRMQRYNVQDVRLTEQLYRELRPWIRTHPSVNLVTGQADSCPRCGSAALVKRGLVHTKVSTFQQYQCNSCKAYSRSGKRTKGVDLRSV